MYLLSFVNADPFCSNKSLDVINTPSVTRPSVKYVCSKPISGIKLQLLHVLKNTPLEKEYFLNQFHIYSLEEYASLLGECICNIPSDIVIHRLTGDGPKSLLIEPHWSGNKKLVLNYINKYFNDMDIIQGKYL